MSCSNDATGVDQNGQNSSTGQSSNITAKVGNCTEVSGWASQNGGTTGGGSSAETVVTNYAQLKAAAENSAVKVLKVTGTINYRFRINPVRPFMGLVEPDLYLRIKLKKIPAL